MTDPGNALGAHYHRKDDGRRRTRSNAAGRIARDWAKATRYAADNPQLSDPAEEDLPGVRRMEGRMEREVERALQEGEVRKVWICGPPRMNEGLAKYLRETYKNPELYLIL